MEHCSVLNVASLGRMSQPVTLLVFNGHTLNGPFDSVKREKWRSEAGKAKQNDRQVCVVQTDRKSEGRLTQTSRGGTTAFRATVISLSHE